MNIVLTGGTGLIGSAVLRELLKAGHDVTAIARSDSSARTMRDLGASAIEGHLTDVRWLTTQLRISDGAVHVASPGDATSVEVDDAVLDAVIAAFVGRDKPFVHTGGIWVWGDNADITESDPLRPPALTGWRVERERRLLASGVKASVIAPAVVYGHGQGIPAMIAAGPRAESGALRLVGTGDQHWTTVHVDDLADLYLAVLATAPGGGTYIGASGQNPTVREIGEAAAGEVVADDIADTRERLGAQFADALLLDQQASGALAKKTFGWKPNRPSLLDELRGA